MSYLLGERTRNLRVEWKPQDAWIGAFWKKNLWFGGSMEALRASVKDPYDESMAHRSLDVWVCLLPMVPIHFTSVWCPQPRTCGSRSCPFSVPRPVDLGEDENDG